ncbi:hypothetical protein [Burkholderia mayonis]|uniref:hypothetical protein n=1 Tax=Burkholderia mayonis TaxID=1385591 RepID=UPI00076BDF71|nr:hypothetical protein [Burkholderia mayonis]KVE54027.1 hypothetical protein WS71_05460 [Burkholderia mayonis]
MQTDQLSEEMGHQLRFYKGWAKAAKQALSQERAQIDAMRRLLRNRAHVMPERPASGDTGRS